MTEMAVSRPTYDEFLKEFSWDKLYAMADWPAHEKYNMGHEICDRWANNPLKADQLALRYETKDGQQAGYTYRQLRDLSNQFANVLTGLGIQKGDRVGGLLPKTPAILPALIGIWKTGAIYVPLFTAFAAPAVGYRLRHSETCAVITDPANLPKVREAQQQGEGLPELKHLIVVGDENASFEGAVNFWAALKAASTEFKVVETGPDDLMEIQYTSGSTGNPKGALMPHRMGIGILPYLLYAVDLREDDVYWGAADPGWAYGLIIGLVAPLLLGNTATMIEAPFNAELCWQVLERYGITNFTYAPTAYRALVAAGPELAHKYNLKLRVASSAGEPLNPEVIEWFQRELGVPVYDHYGQTELSMIVCNYHAFSNPVKPGSMGLPMPGYNVGLVDENGQEVPAGVPGQIAINRKSFGYFFQGYWRDPEKTAANHFGDWHLSGDMARKDEDGYFWFEGRSDDLINTSGYRVGPFEIESALLEHPSVTEAAVISIPDPQRGEAIKAYVTLKPGVEGNQALIEELQQIVRERVGKHAFPRQFAFVDTLPKTPSGKIQRFILRQQSKG
jgi:acetyl-CoA synthetase